MSDTSYTLRMTQKRTMMWVLFIWHLKATDKTHAHTFTQAVHRQPRLQIGCDPAPDGFHLQNRNEKINKACGKITQTADFLKTQVSVSEMVRNSLGAVACSVNMVGTEHRKCLRAWKWFYAEHSKGETFTLNPVLRTMHISSKGPVEEMQELTVFQ